VAQEFQIPVSFEFRAAKKIQWQAASAKVTGWRDSHPEPKKPLHLIAKLRGAAGLESQIAIPLSKLPERERKACLATIGKRESDERVKEICSSLELPYFFHNGKTYFGDDVRKHSLPSDAWQLRDEFLSLQGNAEKTLAFLNNWGRWLPLRRYVGLAEIADLQKDVRAALTESPDEWFVGVAFPTMVNSRSPEFPYFTMLTDACQVAIRMATTIDLLQRIEFKTCARPDCAKPFPVRSKRKRDYCSQYCAHLESVRRGRSVKEKH
jgi:hypothetical protein